jgi:hypothetical protein
LIQEVDDCIGISGLECFVGLPVHRYQPPDEGTDVVGVGVILVRVDERLCERFQIPELALAVNQTAGPPVAESTGRVTVEEAGKASQVVEMAASRFLEIVRLDSSQQHENLFPVVVLCGVIRQCQANSRALRMEPASFLPHLIREMLMVVMVQCPGQGDKVIGVIVVAHELLYPGLEL